MGLRNLYSDMDVSDDEEDHDYADDDGESGEEGDEDETTKAPSMIPNLPPFSRTDMTARRRLHRRPFQLA